MTLVIDIGLERYFYGDEQGEFHRAALIRLVESGVTKHVRDFIGKEIFEVKRIRQRVSSGYLDSEQRKPIDEDFARLGDTYVDFSWDMLDTMGAYSIQTLALRIDAAETPSEIIIPRGDGDDVSVRVIDIRRSLKLNWTGNRHPKAKAAAAFHRFASKHRMIVHSE